MQINKQADGTLLIVELIGQLIGDDAIDLRQNIDAWDTLEQAHVALDLSGVSFIDSTGIGAIVAAHKTLKRVGKNVYFIGAIGQVGEMMKFLRIDKVIPCYTDLAMLKKEQKL
ncbi:MAG: STAS domain-containing protein [Oceanococcus sp.]